MVASDRFAEFLRDQLAPARSHRHAAHVRQDRRVLRRVHARDGEDNTLYFRVDDDNRAAFKEAESFPPLDYQKKGGTIDLSFWRAPERLFDEPDELVIWARAAPPRRGGCGEERTYGAKAKIKVSIGQAGMRAEADPSARPLGRFCRRMRLASLVRAFALGSDPVGLVRKSQCDLSGQTSRSRAPSLRHTPE
jgi:DNA transformation protein